jgi:hypothetical protein
VILLFTSKRDDRPYHTRDLLNACCVPSGTEIQFGYRNKWVADNLKSGERLTGQDALIVFCERDTTGKGIFNYHPIRLAKILNGHPENDSLTIILQLGGMFDYEKYSSQVSHCMEIFKQYVLSNDDQPTPSNTAHHPRFVREDRDWDRSDFAGKWLPLVEYMGALEGLKECIFFCELETSIAESKMRPLSSGKSMSSGTLQYSVEAGKSYQVGYRLFFGQTAAHRPVEIVVDEKVATVAGPFLNQWSSGIEAKFVVNFRRSFEAEISILSVKASTHPQGNIDSPQIAVLLKVGVARYVLYGAIGLMTVGVFLLGNPFQMCRLEWLPKVLGLAAFATGSWIGFRKLPFKAD